MSNKRYIFNDDVLIENNGFFKRNEKFKSLINPIEKIVISRICIPGICKE